MSVAGIFASSLFSGPVSQVAQKLATTIGLGSESGNTSGAQSPFAAIQQKASAQASSSSLPAQVKQLGADLTSGNLRAAQTDYSNLKLTLSKSPASQLTHLLGGPKSTGIDGFPANTSGTANAGDSSSNPLTAAWQAYSSLQQNSLNNVLSNTLGTNASSLSIDI